ncbi:unnamed protein product [Meganyctiphanes norvegica]|uniref:Uncharacterized protein n=1 Tax=Meganyctiphanes norvegica TaxID=48144 RepID=A0AAV2STP5_MEGNR
MKTTSFHSIVEGVDNVNDVNELIGEAIQYQYMFETRRLPSESLDVCQDDLHNFNIDINKINRLYYIHHSDNTSHRKYQLLARMDYNYEHVFVKLSAGYEFTRFGCLGGGAIYVTKNANTFFNLMVEERYNKMKICQSLQEDGYSVSELNSSQVPNENQCRITELLAMRCNENVQSETMTSFSSHDNYSFNYPRVQHPQYADLHYT